jgi:hypothetical protein
MHQYPDNIFTCVDVRGITVNCLYDDWQYILHHREMRDKESIVQEILHNPDFINRDKDFRNRENYYKLVTLTRNIRLVKVVVEFKKPFLKKKIGNLYNAFACGVEKQGEVRVWTKK